MKQLFLFFATFFVAATLLAQQKKPLDHSVYDHWKDLQHPIISDNGNYISYEVNPQEGDGWLYLYKVKTHQLDSLPRGRKAHFTPDGKVLVYTIKAPFAQVLHLERQKVKKDKLPKDSLACFYTESGKWRKFGQILKVAIPEKSSPWIAALMKESNPKKSEKKDNTPKKKTKKPSEKTEKGVLLLFNTATMDSTGFRNVTTFALSQNGKSCVFSVRPSDTTNQVIVLAFHTGTKKTDTLFTGNAVVKNVAVDEKGEQAAFTFSTDTVPNKAFGLYYVDLDKNTKNLVSGTDFKNLRKGWAISTHGKIFFNKAGSELYFGTAPKPLPPLKDTLAPSEKVSLDIWTYHDTLLQPQQKVELKKEKKRNYTAVYFPKENRLVQLATPQLREVRINPKAEGNLSLGFDNRPYLKMTSWAGQWYKDVYLINRETGKRKRIIRKVSGNAYLSPNQQYVAWYNVQDSAWYAYSVKTGKNIKLTKTIPVAFYNVLNDVPNMAPPYGMAGWTKNNRFVVYDRYDLWSLDPSGKQKPVNLTSGMGRKEDLRFRYVNLDKEAQTLPDKMLLSAFQLKNKKAGFYSLQIKNRNPRKLLLEDYAFRTPIKAKKAPVIIWRKESFRVYPDLYVSNLNFSDARQISHANPQQKNYLWGNVKLVQWVTFNGDTMQGLLYTPGNFDPAKKYPMIVYFYERYSNRLHRYYAPRPIRSVINFSYYTSNGYVIFIPDIKYRVGWPGASAYNCVVSGTEAMISRYPFIDRNHIGMQGQSWGGYQSAYIITQTDLFRCAEAGAPVSNMTSAYGGIRWGSGMSREFQYEHTQSRIGGTLWDKLPLYMQNSPLFFVPRIHTPLLIMHNDKDNAVPWYQGIELFNAMRRLNKPVWMLVYNGQPHNLSRRADEKDLTRRFQQFFDYYLKGAPEPKWMKQGIPAIEKGRDFGFETERKKDGQN